MKVQSVLEISVFPVYCNTAKDMLNLKIDIMYLLSGGTLKIYGESISPDVPYKTLLLSSQDTAEYVVEETLNKYGLEKEDPTDYCLIQVINRKICQAQCSLAN